MFDFCQCVSYLNNLKQINNNKLPLGGRNCEQSSVGGRHWEGAEGALGCCDGLDLEPGGDLGVLTL